MSQSDLAPFPALPSGKIIAFSALLLAQRIVWHYLPYAIDRALAGEITWGELRPLVAYLIRADAGCAVFFEGAEAPYRAAYPETSAEHWGN